MRAENERADPLRSADLVGGDDHRIDTVSQRFERHPAGHLHTVAYDEGASRTAALSDRFDGLQHARFAVGFADRQQTRRACGEPCVERVQPQCSVRLDRQARDVGRGEAAALADAGMVRVDDGKTRKQDIPPVPHPVRGQAGGGGFGRAAREDDGLALCARQRGDLGPGLCDDGSRDPALRVNRRRIAVTPSAATIASCAG